MPIIERSLATKRSTTRNSDSWRKVGVNSVAIYPPE